MATIRLCSIPDCGKKTYGHGWCQAHYLRWWRHGDPLAGATAMGAAQRFLKDIVLQHSADQCLIWPFARGEHGYALIRNTAGSNVVSNIVCEAINGPAPTEDHQSAHECGKGHEGCVAPMHLTWKTRSDNHMDRVKHGTSNRGERCAASKLTAAQVREIRGLAGTMTNLKIADRYQ
ncbi:MAG: hypothetical protein PS018_00540, partial [bacterium]|nr:hypothetical protein [bacterium]